MTLLTQAQVRRYAAESGLRDIMIAEKEIVLTFLLQLLSEGGLLDRFAFKGGLACARCLVTDAGDSLLTLISPVWRNTTMKT
jgi:predicted nucleotidyltransferase component of viral defense system